MHRKSPATGRRSTLDRRQWLMGASAAVAAAGVGQSVRAIEPIVRGDFPPRFRFSLAAYSYRELLGGESPSMTLFDFVDDCVAMGLDGTELTSYYFPRDLSDAYLAQLKAHCFRRGIEISGTAVGNDFGYPPGRQRDQQLESVKRWVRHAALLGAPVIRIFAGNAKSGVDPEAAYRLMVEGIEECCEYAGQHGVYLALENHGGPTATIDGLMRFVEDVQSPWFAVNLDTGNFRSDDICRDLARAAPYALNVQVKVLAPGAEGRREPTDYRRLAGLLRDAGYRGYVVLEYEEGGDPRAESRKAMDALRAGFADV